ncbi:MAG: DUF1152 domain-containing protein [Bacteroidota bacterium]
MACNASHNRLIDQSLQLHRMEIPIKQAIASSKKILLSGLGGGYDIYSAIPLYFTLRGLGKEVVLTNYSFSYLPASGGERIGDSGWLVTKASEELGYFPEKYLIEWLNHLDHTPKLIGFEKTGVVPLRNSLETICEQEEIDTLILVDGGTDSLMKGDEAGLGTPVEDITGIAAASKLSIKQQFMVCVGFGIDHFHGVCHSQYLENVAELIRNDGFYGVSTFTKSDELGVLFLDLVEYANERGKAHPSIVANSIASAVAGQFGNHHATHRTLGSKLYINPLMAVHWFFDLQKVAQHVLYLHALEGTQTEEQALKVIVEYRKTIQPKAWEDIPL